VRATQPAVVRQSRSSSPDDRVLDAPPGVSLGTTRWTTARLARPDRREDTLIEPGSTWEKGCCVRFNSKLRDEFLAGELFSTLYKAKVLIERWRRLYNTTRPIARSARPPAPKTGHAVGLSARLRCAPASRTVGHQGPGGF
jgi:hypothetical protein